jgi:hypothetical protein
VGVAGKLLVLLNGVGHQEGLSLEVREAGPTGIAAPGL